MATQGAGMNRIKHLNSYFQWATPEVTSSSRTGPSQSICTAIWIPTTHTSRRLVKSQVHNVKWPVKLQVCTSSMFLVLQLLLQKSMLVTWAYRQILETIFMFSKASIHGSNSCEYNLTCCINLIWNCTAAERDCVALSSQQTEMIQIIDITPGAGIFSCGGGAAAGLRFALPLYHCIVNCNFGQTIYFPRAKWVCGSAAIKMEENRNVSEAEDPALRHIFTHKGIAFQILRGRIKSSIVAG